MKKSTKNRLLTYGSASLFAMSIALVIGGGGGISPIEEGLQLDQKSNSEKGIEEVPDEVKGTLEKLKSGADLIKGMIIENPDFLYYLKISTDLQFEGQHQLLFSEIFNPESEQKGEIKPSFRKTKLFFKPQENGL